MIGKDFPYFTKRSKAVVPTSQNLAIRHPLSLSLSLSQKPQEKRESRHCRTSSKLFITSYATREQRFQSLT